MAEFYKDFKVGLSNADKERMANQIAGNLHWGSPSGVAPEEVILAFTENKGVWVSEPKPGEHGETAENNGYWFYWKDDENLPNKGYYVKGGYFQITETVQQILGYLTYNKVGLLAVSDYNEDSGEIIYKYDNQIIDHIDDTNLEDSGEIKIYARLQDWECKPKEEK